MEERGDETVQVKEGWRERRREDVEREREREKQTRRDQGKERETGRRNTDDGWREEDKKGARKGERSGRGGGLEERVGNEGRKHEGRLERRREDGEGEKRTIRDQGTETGT